jgi:general nucleoside transport system ATP-binding protein
MHVTLEGVTKRYGDFVANENVSLTIRPGEVHCLLGENGAGKTTLMNVIYGLSRPDGGVMKIDGAPVSFSSPKDAIAAGLGMVHQHFMLIPAFTVTENVVLGQEPTLGLDRLDKSRAREKVRQISEQFGLAINPDAMIEGMPVGIQQRVEIVKLLYRSAELMIFDEPTAVLTPQEVTEFFKIVSELRASGKAILFITHKLNEVMAIADQITVMRLGKVVGTAKPAETSPTELASMMVGRPVVMQVQREPAEPQGDALAVRNLSVADGAGHLSLRDVSLSVRAGEIVGIAGVHGNGQTELVEAIAGLRELATGSVHLAGDDISELSPRGRHRRGMAHVPEDRSHTGLATSMAIYENMVLDCYYEPQFTKLGHIDWQAVREQAQKLAKQYDVRTSSIEATAGSLSGGNQQKVVIARELGREIKLLIAAQPTRGVDVGSIEYIHQQIVAARDSGVGVLLVSTELDEILALSDRVLAMYGGQVIAEFGQDADREQLGLAMAGIRPDQKDVSS